MSGPHRKGSKSRDQVRQILAHFLQTSYSNVKLKLSYNYQNCQKVKFGRACYELEAKNCLQRQSSTKYLRPAVVFMGKSTLWGKFKFYASID